MSDTKTVSSKYFTVESLEFGTTLRGRWEFSCIIAQMYISIRIRIQQQYVFLTNDVHIWSTFNLVALSVWKAGLPSPALENVIPRLFKKKNDNEINKYMHTYTDTYIHRSINKLWPENGFNH